MNFLITLRGEELEIEAEITPAEPDVGIMSAGIGEFEAKFTSTGLPCEWEFTDEEIDRLNEVGVEAYYEDQMGGDE